MAVSGSHLAALPDELCESIFCRLPGSDLKNLRLTSNKLSRLSASVLFEDIILIPTRECLTGFSSILASSNLGRCVRKLDYDERWIDVLEWLSKSPSCTPEGLGRISLMQADFFDKVVDVETEVELLYAICKTLPNLTTVEVFEHNKYTHTSWNPREEHIPSYLRSRNTIPSREIPKLLTGFNFQRTAEAQRSVSKTVFNIISMTDSRVTRLGIHGIGLQFLIEPEQAQTGNAMTRPLRSMDLSRLTLLLIVVDWPRFSPHFSQSLANVISTASNLTELRLSLGEDTYEQQGFQTDDCSSWCLMTRLGRIRRPFPALKSMTLDHMCCFEQDLRGFLSRNVASLKQLTLGNGKSLPAS